MKKYKIEYELEKLNESNCDDIYLTNKYYYEALENIFRDISEQNNGDTLDDIFIAGGFCFEFVKNQLLKSKNFDIDIYFKNNTSSIYNDKCIEFNKEKQPKEKQPSIKLFDEDYADVSISSTNIKHALNKPLNHYSKTNQLLKNATHYQYIITRFGDVYDVLCEFDFSCCKLAIMKESTGFYLCVHKDFSRKLIHYNDIKYQSFERYIKYLCTKNANDFSLNSGYDIIDQVIYYIRNRFVIPGSYYDDDDNKTDIDQATLYLSLIKKIYKSIEESDFNKLNLLYDYMYESFNKLIIDSLNDDDTVKIDLKELAYIYVNTTFKRKRNAEWLICFRLMNPSSPIKINKRNININDYIICIHSYNEAIKKYPQYLI